MKPLKGDFLWAVNGPFGWHLQDLLEMPGFNSGHIADDIEAA
jgi:hypothetical protein